ncbi:MAG: hypothetical protein ACQESA_02980 [Patescibacteria group bacterium]
MSFFDILRRKIIAECGHETFVRDELRVLDEIRDVVLPIINDKTPFCHLCLEKMTIGCAWCGRPIFIGDPITLCFPRYISKIPNNAVIYKINSLIMLVGCLRIQCANECANKTGFWHPPGRVLFTSKNLSGPRNKGKMLSLQCSS